MQWLGRGGGRPERRQERPAVMTLLQLIGTLMDETPGELVGGEVDPGLSLTVGGGHA